MHNRRARKIMNLIECLLEKERSEKKRQSFVGINVCVTGCTRNKVHPHSRGEQKIAHRKCDILEKTDREQIQNGNIDYSESTLDAKIFFGSFLGSSYPSRRK